MLPMKSVRLQLGELLAADDTTLAPAANGNKVALVKANFNPEENMEVGDITLADFNGSTPKLCGTGTQQVGIDPATGDQLITILEPAGGFRFECGADPDPAQDIFGFALLNNDLTVLLGLEKFDEAVTIAEAGQEINLGTVKMRLVTEPLS